MQYDGFDDGPTWGVRSPRDGDGDLGMVKDTMRKEQVIKSVLSISQMFYFGFYL
jgi:short coiled-coil protein